MYLNGLLQVSILSSISLNESMRSPSYWIWFLKSNPSFWKKLPFFLAELAIFNPTNFFCIFICIFLEFEAVVRQCETYSLESASKTFSRGGILWCLRAAFPCSIHNAFAYFLHQLWKKIVDSSLLDFEYEGWVICPYSNFIMSDLLSSYIFSFAWVV